jgi:hypothetical protein
MSRLEDAGRTSGRGETSEVAKADSATLLRDYVTLKCRSIDRNFLQAYVLKLQSVGQVCIFLRWRVRTAFVPGPGIRASRRCGSPSPRRLLVG